MLVKLAVPIVSSPVERSSGMDHTIRVCDLSSMHECSCAFSLAISPMI